MQRVRITDFHKGYNRTGRVTFMQKTQFLIGATSSGSGKTTLTLGLLRALRNRGLQVQPFKCGPDYLDTKHHTAAAGHESFNLDSFMSAPEHIKNIYSRLTHNADISVVEGVMGLFDGYNKIQGSSAEIAEILDLPVILILNACSTAYSIAPILYGFKHFRPDLNIAGAIFNFVSSESHYHHLQQACQDVGIEPLGYLPKCPGIEIPSRHLGLNIDKNSCFDEFADRIATLIEKTVQLEKLLKICNRPIPSLSDNPVKVKFSPYSRIAIAYDEAFNFIYPANIHALARLGKITFFSPLKDKILPQADFVYLPGGYPELYLEELSANESMRNSIYHYCQHNGRLFAECGGMMYLGQFIKDTEGHPYPMCGFLPQGATMENMKLKLGYRKVIVNGKEYRGHEFHYSGILPGTTSLLAHTQVFNAQGKETDTPIYRQKAVTASYIHFYWGDLPEKIEQFTE